MSDATEHYNLQKAGGPNTQNKWALWDGDMDLIERGRTIAGLAGEDLEPLDLVYLNPYDGKFWKATNDDRPLAGLVVEAADADTQVFVQEEGLASDIQVTPSWNWTPFLSLFADPTTAGALTQDAPDRSAFYVGIALSATQIWIYRSGLHARLVAEPMLTLVIPGDPAAGTTVSARIISPITGTLRSIKHLVKTAASAQYTYDINKNGTTIYTTQANRPTRTGAMGTGLVTATLPDVLAAVTDDIFEADLDIKGSGLVDLVFFIQLSGVGPA